MADLLQAIDQYKSALQQKECSIEALCTRRDALSNQLRSWSVLASSARLQDVDSQICKMQSVKSSIEHQLQVSCYEQFQHVLMGLKALSSQDQAWLSALADSTKATQKEVEDKEQQAADALRNHLITSSGHAAAMSLIEREIQQLNEETAALDASTSSLLPATLSLCSQSVRLDGEARSTAREVQETQKKVDILKQRVEEAKREVEALDTRIADAKDRAKASHTAAAKSESEAASIHAACDAFELKRHQEAMNLAANKRAAELAGAKQVVLQQAAAGYGPPRPPAAPVHTAPVPPPITRHQASGAPMPRPVPMAMHHQQVQGQGGKAWQLPVPAPPAAYVPGPRPQQPVYAAPAPPRGYGPGQGHGSAPVPLHPYPYHNGQAQVQGQGTGHHAHSASHSAYDVL